MDVYPDLKDLFELFNANKVDYMIVDGYALAFHAAPRYTGDIDIFVKPDASNAARILKALDKFGFGSLGLAVADFNSPDKVVQLGVPLVRIDLVTSITGVSWDDAVARSIGGKYGNIPVKYIGREEFVVNKRSTGRKKDLADLEALVE